MEEHLPLITSILILLVASRLLGEIFGRLKQSPIIGEVLAGILLGPAVLDLVGPSDHLAGIAELSVFLIVVSAGLEMEFGQVIRAFYGRGLIIALLGFFIPFLSGLLLGVVFMMDAMHTIFLGLCISITALPVALRILENFDLLHTNIGQYSISTSVLNDVVALLFLGVILDRPIEGGFSAVAMSVLITASKMLLLAVLVFLASRVLRWGGMQTGYIERALDRAIKLFGPEMLFGISVVFVLVFASMSEALGSHFVIGSFFGGLLLSRDVFGGRLFGELERTLNSVTTGFLAPIFFAFIGLQLTGQSFEQPIFLISLLLIAVVSKVYAGYLGGRLARLRREEALGIGVILNGRGIMELVVASIALQKGLIEESTFSALVMMGIFTTFITPLLFRFYVSPRLAKPAPATAPHNA